jgi:peptide chain release factor subunit 1
MVLLSSNLRKSRLIIRCQSCSYEKEETVQVEPGMGTGDLDFGNCPRCSAPLYLEDETDIIDELTELADLSGSSVMIISDDFEEGAMLANAFGGIAAVLRYRTGY